MKIALMYLNVTNLGDLVIFETAKYILTDILKKNNISDYEIIPVDIGSASKRSMSGNDISIGWSLKNKLSKLTIRLLEKLKFTKIFPKAKGKILVRQWHQTDDYLYYLKHEKGKLKDVDLILFGGGGLIKFHQQNFHFFLDDVTEFAQKNNIPVIISAQGVEGYSENNPECKLLKNALNRDCVKFVSTRDDYKMLSEKYITNPNIETAAVCDPAFWTPETYGVHKNPCEPKKVGLNVIRTPIFGDYMYPVNANLLAKMYSGLIKKLYDAGYKVELFSNGVARDAEFVEILYNRYPEVMRECQVTVANPQTTEELVRLISGYDRYMAVRLHASIIGTVMGIPNISLVWNKKQPLFGKQVGMPQNYLKKKDFNADTVFERLMAAKPYEMDYDYKQTVYSTVEKQVLKYIQK